jgi:hypothetical protein
MRQHSDTSDHIRIFSKTSSAIVEASSLIGQIATLSEYFFFSALLENFVAYSCACAPQTQDKQGEKCVFMQAHFDSCNCNRYKPYFRRDLWPSFAFPTQKLLSWVASRIFTGSRRLAWEPVFSVELCLS